VSKSKVSSKVKILYLLDKCYEIGYEQEFIYDFFTGNKKKKENVRTRIERIIKDFVYSEGENLGYYAEIYDVSQNMITQDCKYIIRKLAWLIARYQQYGEKYEMNGGNPNINEIENVLQKMNNDLDIEVKSIYDKYKHFFKEDEKGSKWMKFFEEKVGETLG
jgi:hypothetical protein